MAKLSTLGPTDLATLATLTMLTERAALHLPGYWSIDWLWTTDRGWILTDMAEGDRSFKWDPDRPTEPVTH